MAVEEGPIFTDSEFGLEVVDVVAFRSQTETNVLVQAELLKDEYVRVRRMAEQGQSRLDKQVAFFEAHDDETVLAGMRYVFERGKELDAIGMPTVDVAMALYNEAPEVLTISPLFEMQPWGYRFVQITMATLAVQNSPH